MKKQDRQQFADIISATYLMFNPKAGDIPRNVLGLWWTTLQDYSIADVEKAFAHYLRNPDNGHFAPKPADIVRIIDGSTHNRALRAWTAVTYAVRLYGPYQSVDLGDPAIHEAIRFLGGWSYLCGLQETEWPFIQKTFETHYLRSCTQGRVLPHHPLIGMEDHARAQRGLPCLPPKKLGSFDQNRIPTPHAESVFLSQKPFTDSDASETVEALDPLSFSDPRHQ